MSHFSGRDGVLYIDNQQVAKVRSWSLTHNQAVLQPQSLGDTDAIVLPDLRNLSGSAELLYYADGPASNITQLLQNCIKVAGSTGTAVTSVSSEVRLALGVKDPESGERSITFGCYITSFGAAMTIGDVMQATIAFQANGAPVGMGL